MPSGKLVGIKYNRKNFKCTSEYVRAIHEEQQAIHALKQIEEIKKGELDFERNEDIYEFNLNFNESDVEEQTQNKILEWKEEKYEWFKLECNIVDLDAKIKGCLGLDKAEPKKALEYLNDMYMLDIKPLMLKKHAHVVDMVKRLRKYIGNVTEWNLTGDCLDIFKADATKIRTRAEELYQKFKVIVHSGF